MFLLRSKFFLLNFLLIFICFGQITLAVDMPFEATDVNMIEITPAENPASADLDESKGGVYTLNSIFVNIYAFLKYLMITLGVGVLIYGGVRLVTAGKEIESVVSEQKLNLKYIVYGAGSMLLLDVIVSTIFGTGNNSGVELPSFSHAVGLKEEIFGLVGFIMAIAGTIAMAMIVFSCFKVLTSFGNEEALGKQKKTIGVSLGGLILMAVARVFMNNFFGIAGNTMSASGSFILNSQAIANEILGFANYALGFVSLLSTVFLVYGAFLWVTAGGNDDGISKGKQVMTSAVVGILISVISFTLVNTIVNIS